MQLNNTTTTLAIDGWSDICATSWTADQKNQLEEQLVELAAHVEPHLVEDIALNPVRIQSYLLARTVARLEDWLVLAAASLRRSLRIEMPRLNPGTDEPALGLRSASHDDLEALPGIGDNLAQDIRHYLAIYPRTDDLDDLLNINGIGPNRVEQLRDLTYLDHPTFNAVSLTIWTFALNPTINNALILLDNSDVSLLLGDYNAINRSLSVAPASTYSRFSQFVELVSDQAKLSMSGAAGSISSEADQWLSTHEKRKDLLAHTQAASGLLLVNQYYLETVKVIIDSAANSIALMVFLGTMASSDDGIAPLPLIEALEAAANRGVDVKVILDQDDGGEPYGSFFINMPLVQRFKTNAVNVKLDTKDTLLHSKVLVADESTCVVGSHNWTRAGLTRTHELSVLINNTVVTASFQQRFNALWDNLPAV